MKKFILAAIAVILIVVSVFAVSCDTKEQKNEQLEGKNIFYDVFEAAKDWDTEEPEGYYNCWQRDPIQIWGVGKKVEYTSWDVVTGEELPYNNWGAFSFDFKTKDYRVTKIEFDVIFNEDCSRYFYVYSRDADTDDGKRSPQQEIQAKAGEIQHLVFDNLTFRKIEKWGWVGIQSTPVGIKTGDEFAKGALIEWKLMNLKVYGELV